MNRKIYITILAVFAVVLCAGTASAGMFDIFESGENTTVTLDGIDFNIPAGFEEDPKFEIVNKTQSAGVDFIMNGKTYTKGNDVVSLLVSDYGEHKVDLEVIESLGGNATTVNGVDGYVGVDGEFYTFSYPVNGKLVVLSSNKQALFEEFVVA